MRTPHLTREEIVRDVLRRADPRKGFQPKSDTVRRLLDAYLAVANRDAPDWSAISGAAEGLDGAIRPLREEFLISPHDLDDEGTISLRGAVPVRDFRRLLAFLKRLGESPREYDPARSLAAFFAAKLYVRPPPAHWPHYEDIACLLYRAFAGPDPNPDRPINLKRECQAVRRGLRKDKNVRRGLRSMRRSPKA